MTYVAIPSTGGAALLSAATGLVAVILTLTAVRRYRSASARSWNLFAVGLSLWVAGDLAFAGNAFAPGNPAVEYLVNACYLSAYPFMVVALFRLTRTREARDSFGALDTAVIATGLGIVYWIFVIGPVAENAAMPPLARFLVVAYPTCGVLLCAVVLPLLLRSGRRTPSVWLLTMGSIAVLLGNVAFTVMPADAATLSQWVFGGYLFAYLCYAGAAAHPSAHRSPATRGASLGRGRLLLLAVTSLLVPGVLLLEGFRRPQDIDWLAISIGSILLFLLVLARLAGFVDQVRAQATQLEDMAMRDDLTGLANRRRFEQRLTESMQEGQPQVAMLDLSGFKAVNDRFGHTVGDRLLAEVGHRMAQTLRPGDVAARMGGDEFAVLVPDTTAGAMDGIVERLTQALRRPVVADGHELLINASFGTATCDETDDPHEVIRRADVAMYVAKSLGEGRRRRYTRGMDVAAGEQARMGAEMRQALDTGQFRLVYQPIVELPSGRTVAVETLVRWEHPVRGPVSPAEFIPVAEQNGLIVELGAWILKAACAQAAIWRDELGPAAPRRIGVNVSARQLAEPGFPELVANVLAWTGLGADKLTIEVTETAVFGGGQALRAVKALYELGVKIALDDFGTGHSSLTLLQTLPVNILKVDKSFVDNISMAGRHAVIATALIQVSNGLGLDAVAEGVETAEQAAELHRLGYRLAQGYYFGRPAAQPDFAASAELPSAA
ncbi:putative bifunctional diguanylate cyclase/phosphodiesterase [Mangrovihabitans endophyticus]|uniref:putative bifunctional diguanylate cyclase/phosphodiesterase n=1 Tax=Mangrovihabitans endophyticus TaxID=1751298 RepID=UPI001E5D161C|nr:bifunctional diguanylate cyclase/phosphodiesterase [Mangrovihabitans endophyticus]